MAEQQRLIRFSGNVQGVGFRHTTTQTARGFDVTGYVKNLPDGKVELLVEGDRKEIDAFLDDLRQSMGQYIRNESAQSAEPSGRYTSFSVAF